MPDGELTPENFKRISLINWVLTIPLLILFAWPYTYLGSVAGMEPWILYPGAVLFAAPFTLTILHGHTTLALGSVHRHHYYEWLKDHPLTFGLLFHPVLFTTRLRLILLVASLILFLSGWLLT